VSRRKPHNQEKVVEIVENMVDSLDMVFSAVSNVRKCAKLCIEAKRGYFQQLM
jgi:hypothetical protein